MSGIAGCDIAALRTRAKAGEQSREDGEQMRRALTTPIERGEGLLEDSNDAKYRAVLILNVLLVRLRIAQTPSHQSDGRLLRSLSNLGALDIRRAEAEHAFKVTDDRFATCDRIDLGERGEVGLVPVPAAVRLSYL